MRGQISTGSANVCQADFTLAQHPAFTAESGAYILRAVARAESFSPQPCKSLLPGYPEADSPALLFDLVSRRLHTPKEIGEVGGALCQHKINLAL